ncbi:MAG: hypothetical protein Q4G52_12740 [Clostridia bacterium]|nr:hypothetical protein [Clostridia bacterium]
MPREEVWQAIMRPEPLMSDQVAFAAEDVEMIVLLRELRSAGVSQEELYSLCDTLENGRSYTEKVVRLRRIRFKLLARLHEQQKILDDLDSYVDAVKRGRTACKE